MSITKFRRTRVLLLALAFLVFTTHRLPAPIQEVPETPTPAAKQPIKSKKTPSKSKAVESEAKTQSAAKRPAPIAQGPARFAGAWRGTLAFGIAGDLHLKLVVNNEANSVTESGGLVGTVTFKATNDGKTIRWHSGVVGEIAWELTPTPDGQTALLTAKSPFIGNPSATFQKVSQ